MGEDYFEGKLIVDNEERNRINPFDWAAAFPEVFAQGGFDAVVGNPPYGAELDENARGYLARKFHAGTTDTAALFMLYAKQLTKTNGWNGFIIPKPFAYSSNWQEIRRLQLAELQELIDVGKVWKEVKLEQVIYFLQYNQPSEFYRSMQRIQHGFVYLADIAKSDCIKFGFYLNGIDTTELTIAHKMLSGGKFLGDYMTNVRGGMFQNAVVAQRKGKRVIGGRQVQPFFIHEQKGFVQSDEQLPPNAFVKEDNILVQNIVAHIANPIDHIKIIATIVSDADTKELVILDTVNQLSNKSQLSSKYILGLLLSQLIN